jgi:hypothetical protein
VITQCEYFIRKNIPISCKLGKKNKDTNNDADIVLDTKKEILWREVKLHFNFPEDKEKVLKDWVMMKMAIAFQTFKKKLKQRLRQKGPHARV